MKLLVFPVLAAAAALAPSEAAGPAAPSLAFPLACELGRTCVIQHYVDRDAGPGVKDYRCGTTTYDKHNGVDFRLPDMAAQRRGVAVLAAAPGRVARLRDGVADISVRAPGAPSVANAECGNGVVIDHGGGWETQYCHMARGSIVVKVGDTVAAGTPVGRVGLSGNTEYPHLHFTVRRAGAVVDPFAPTASASCGAQAAGLWRADVAARMTYQAGAVLNAGFAGGEFAAPDVEEGRVPAASAAAPALLAYVRAIALAPGDVRELELKGPDGATLAKTRTAPLERWRAQDLLYVGKRRPAAGWAKGEYVADYKVWRDGRVAVSRRFSLRL
jgi:hypothetical protein